MNKMLINKVHAPAFQGLSYPNSQNAVQNYYFFFNYPNFFSNFAPENVIKLVV